MSSLCKSPELIWNEFLELAKFQNQVSDFKSMLITLQQLFANGHQPDYTKKLDPNSLKNERKGSCITLALIAAAIAIINNIGTPFILLQDNGRDKNYPQEDDTPHKRHALIAICHRSPPNYYSHVVPAIDAAITGKAINECHILDHSTRYGITLFGISSPPTHCFINNDLRPYSQTKGCLSIPNFIKSRQAALRAAYEKKVGT